MHRFWFLFLFCTSQLGAQSVSKSSFAGQWVLSGQREMVAGLDLRADSSFEFFYTYGASDRYATGSWKTWGDSLVLQSRKPAGKDFQIQKQSPGDQGYRIKV